MKRRVINKDEEDGQDKKLGFSKSVWLRGGADSGGNAKRRVINKDEEDKEDCRFGASGFAGLRGRADLGGRLEPVCNKI